MEEYLSLPRWVKHPPPGATIILVSDDVLADDEFGEARTWLVWFADDDAEPVDIHQFVRCDDREEAIEVAERIHRHNPRLEVILW